MEDHNAILRETEPDEYHLLTASTFRKMVLGGKERTVGFCVNSPDASGYCDEDMVWIADQITDPARVIEYSIHECLHAIFPDLPEQEVGQAAEQIAAFVLGVFKVKGEGPLPKLRPLLNEKNVGKLFPGGTVREEVTPQSSAPAHARSPE